MSKKLNNVFKCFEIFLSEVYFSLLLTSTYLSNRHLVNMQTTA